MQVLPLAVAFLTSLALVHGAEKKSAPKDDQPLDVVGQRRAGPVDFAKDILPIFKNNCLACHNQTKAKAGLVLETPQTILKGGDSGAAVVPGRGRESLLFSAASHQSDTPMPPLDNKVAASKLNPSQLRLLQLWIDQGATGAVTAAANIRWNPLPETLNSIYAVALTRDGQFAACGRANRIFIYHIPSGKLSARLTDPALAREPSPPRQTKAAHRDRVYALDFSPDGTLLASGDFREAKLWRQHKADSNFTLPEPPGSDGKSNESPQIAAASTANSPWTLERSLGKADGGSAIVNRVNAIQFSPDGALLATGSGEPTRGGEIKIWTVVDGRLTQEFKNLHSDTVLGLSFSPDGKYLATAAADKLVKVVELITGKLVKSFQGHTHHVLSVTWKNDGKTLASAGADRVIKFWDLATGEGKKTVEGFAMEVTAVCFVGATDQAVACSGDKQVRAIRENGDNVRVFGGANDFMHSVVATPDGKLVAAGGEDGVLRVWNGATGSVVATFAAPTD